jgi:hypothetical protein
MSFVSYAPLFGVVRKKRIARRTDFVLDAVGSDLTRLSREAVAALQMISE